MNKLADFIVMTIVVFIVIVWIGAYLDTPTVYVDTQGNCVTVKTVSGTRDCTHMPDVYETVTVPARK